MSTSAELELEGSDSERPRFYTPTEVAAHNVSSDCWVSYLGKVYDLTPLCQEHSGESRKCLRCSFHPFIPQGMCY